MGILDDLKPLKDHAGWLADFAENPGKKIRKFISGMILGGVAFFLQPWIDTILLIAGGSKPTEFAAPGEIYGIADFPVVFARISGSALAIPIEVFTSVLAGVITEATPVGQGPAEGLAMTALVGGVAYLLIRYGPVVALAAMEMVPTVGPPLARILKGLR